MEKILDQQQLPETVQKEEKTVRTPDLSDYSERIEALSAEDKAFLDGYIFAKMTEAAKKGA